MPLPTTTECWYLHEMIDSSLVDFSYVQPWAEKIVLEVDVPPSWVCDLATQYVQDALAAAALQGATNPPFEEPPSNIERFAVACLFLRYERREISWASFLRLAGERLDASMGEWCCETPFQFLNVFEHAYFSLEAEHSTRTEYLATQDLLPWIELVRSQFEPLKRLRRSKRQT